MSLATRIFGKDLYNITKQDLAIFFQEEQEETSILEFKSGGVQISDLYKEICAFLNTEGGIIIIGSPEEKKVKTIKKHAKRICSGELVPSHFRNKDWLIQKISSNITPVPTGIKIQEIREQNGSYFIIEVPQSFNSPHQSLNDGRYYIRLEEEARPAPHGIIEALFYRRQKPQLKADINIYDAPEKPDEYNKIVIEIRNESEYPTDKISFMLQLYNINDVIPETNNIAEKFQKNEHSYQLQDISEIVLIDEITIPINFYIIHKNAPYIVSVMVWNKEFGIFKNRCIYDPVNETYIDWYKTGEGENERTINDFINNLKEITDSTF